MVPHGGSCEGKDVRARNGGRRLCWLLRFEEGHRGWCWLASAELGGNPKEEVGWAGGLNGSGKIPRNKEEWVVAAGRI